MERLQKAIAQAGVTSRRKAEDLIRAGKVKVNGETVTTLGTKVSASDEIEVNGIPIEKEAPVYFLLYKPSGVLSAVKDDRGRKVVTDFFPHVEKRIFPVGRLDYDTSGLLLLTNDGEFANRLMHPKYELDKTYVAKIEGALPKEKQKELEKGVLLDDGKTAPAIVNVLAADKKKNATIVEMTIHEGRNRQVRRMFDAVGNRVLKLKREKYAFLTVKGMNPGEWRELTPHEVRKLHALSEN
ncbi:MAG TPA: pseudouridine synthase [Bacillales bacterium]|nr:pseudouridine synthase [Bacillales bacterium]